MPKITSKMPDMPKVMLAYSAWPYAMVAPDGTCYMYRDSYVVGR